MGELVLIAGAPRSGTTLLSNLLDSHPDFFVFPMEHGVFETFHNHADKEVFRKAFVVDRQFGSQATLGNAEAYRIYSDKVQRVLHRGWNLKVDTEAFQTEYVSQMAAQPIELSKIFHALAKALAASSDYYRERMKIAKYFVFKQPFHTELYFNKSREQLSATWLHVIRNVLSRYCSAKSRRIRAADGSLRTTRLINRLPANIGHCEIGILSHWMARQNTAACAKYHVVDYEQLTGPARQDYLSSVLTHLGAKSQDLLPTEAGQSVPPNSSSQSADIGPITYDQVTNSAERASTAYFLSCVAPQLPSLGLEKSPFSRAIAYWWLRFKHERWRDYGLRLALSYPYFRKIRSYDCEARLSDILLRMKSRSFQVSGET